MPQQPPSDLYATQPPPDLYGDKPAKDTSFGDSVMNAWHTATDPLLSKVKMNGVQVFDPKAAADYYDPANADPTKQARIPDWVPMVGGGTYRSLGAGTLQGAGDVVNSLSTPQNLATLGAFKGASSLGKVAPLAAKGLRYAGGALSAPIAAHGVATAADSSQPVSNRLFAIPEIAGGIVGMHSGFGSVRPSVRAGMSPEGVQPDTAKSTNQAIIESRQRADQIIKSPNSNELLKPEEIPAAKARYDELYKKGINDPTNFTMGEAKEGIKLYDKLKAVNFGKSGIPSAEDDLVQKPPDPNFPGNARFGMEPNKGVTPPPPVLDPEAQAVRDQTAKLPINENDWQSQNLKPGGLPDSAPGALPITEQDWESPALKPGGMMQNASPEFDPSTLNLETKAPAKQANRAKPAFKNGIRQPAQEYPGFKGVVPDEAVAGHDEAANSLTDWIKKLATEESGELDVDALRRAFTRETSKTTAGPEPEETSLPRPEPEPEPEPVRGTSPITEETMSQWRKQWALEEKRKSLSDVESAKKAPARQRLSNLVGEDRANQLASGERVIESDDTPYRGRANKKVLSKATVQHWSEWGDNQLKQEYPKPDKPGIEIEQGDRLFPNKFKVVYRDESGNVIGVLKTDMAGKGISTLAASSGLGLRRGKVAFAMLKEAFDRGVNEPAGATSDLTKNLIDMVKRLVNSESGEFDPQALYDSLNELMGAAKEKVSKFFSDESGSVDPAILSRLSTLFEKQKNGALSPEEMKEATDLAKQAQQGGGVKATALKNKDVIGAAASGNQPPNQPTSGKQPIPEGAEFPQGNTADPVLAKSVKYAPESQFLNRLSNLSSKTARMVLGTHIPGTAYSFHGLNVAVRNTIFGPDFNPINAGGRFIDTVKYLSSPNKANAYLQLNEAELSKAVKDGGLRATTTDVGNNAMFRGSNLLTKGINALTDPKPLFGKVIPALKLKSYQGLLDQYQKAGMPYDKAAKLAGYATNNIFGGLNLQALERNPTTQKLFRLAALAPDWMESNVRLGQGMAQSLKNPSDPAGRVYQVGMANFLGSYVALNVLSAINNNGKFMFQNEPSHEFDVAMGQDSKGRTRYFAPYGTAMDMLRVPLAIGNAAYTKGDLGQAFREIKNRTSEPGQIVGDLLYNEDYKQSPIYGKEKYGNKMMPASKQLGNIATNTAGHVVPIGANSLLDYMMGNISPEQLATQGFQLPFKYKFPERHKIR
jgi:hypothetical protein